MNEFNNQEKKVADKAKQMLSDALRKRVSSFKEHVRNSSSIKDGKKKKPLRDFDIKERIARRKQKNGTRHLYFNALSLDIGLHGFYQNYGVNTIRRTHNVYREKPHPSHYVRMHHHFKLPKTEFIDKAIKESGIIPYVAKEIGEIRGYAVLQYLIDEMAENINKKR